LAFTSSMMARQLVLNAPAGTVFIDGYSRF
jgi:hypothetical protein